MPARVLERIREISVDDVVARRRWRVVESDDDDPLSWRVARTTKVSPVDVIVHPSITIAGRRAYPSLETRYYEDGGEPGEHFIHDGKRWVYVDGRPMRLAGEIEESWLGFVSNRDVHERQEGAFSNRKEHYEHFEFYAAQIGRRRVQPFPEPVTVRLRPVEPSAVDRRIDVICSELVEAAALQRAGKVASGNKKIVRAGRLIEELKGDERGRSALCTLLADPRRVVRLTMMYALLDVDRARCLEVIRQVARERSSLEGLAARINLPGILAKGG